MHIAVFDSGKGGKLIATGLWTLLPDHEYHVISDTAHVPYGSRSNEEIIELTDAALESVIDTCPIIIIACNTATMAALPTLRARYPHTLFIGTEPMIKPAGQISLARHITVLATPLTLKSERYQQLKDQFASDLVIDEPSTHHWARAIENGETDEINVEDIAVSVMQGSDVIVLACTHYLELKPRLEATFPGVRVLEPTSAIAEQVARLVLQVQ
jgi:glutamate racemase